MPTTSLTMRETLYNEIHDSQRHFRTLLDSMSRPGKLNHFAAVTIQPPKMFSRGCAFVALALLNQDARFWADGWGEDVVRYLQVNTHSPHTEVSKADYLFLSGMDLRAEEWVAAAKLGLPIYPETGATLVVAVERLGKSSAVGGCQLTLEGPGIERQESVFVTGLRPELLAAVKERNREFPLGLDVILVGEGETICGLPRTTRITWNLN